MHFQQVFLGSHRPFSGLRIFGCDAELKPQGECSQLCTRASRAASYTSSASVIWHVVSFGQNGTYRPDTERSKDPTSRPVSRRPCSVSGREWKHHESNCLHTIRITGCSSAQRGSKTYSPGQ